MININKLPLQVQEQECSTTSQQRCKSNPQKQCVTQYQTVCGNQNSLTADEIFSLGSWICPTVGFLTPPIFRKVLCKETGCVLQEEWHKEGDCEEQEEREQD